MAIHDLFSKRQADAANSGIIDVYQYDNIPMNLRIQINQIAGDALGKFGTYGGYLHGTEDNPLWFNIEKVFLREKGFEQIGNETFAGERIQNFMKKCSTEDWLDFV